MHFSQLLYYFWCKFYQKQIQMDNIFSQIYPLKQYILIKFTQGLYQRLLKAVSASSRSFLKAKPLNQLRYRVKTKVLKQLSVTSLTERFSRVDNRKKISSQIVQNIATDQIFGPLHYMKKDISKKKWFKGFAKNEYLSI